MSFLIAHRGRSATAPENTMAAFEAAVEAGFPWVETDVDLLADGTPVLIHDATLERTTDGSGPVARLTADQLAEYDAGSWLSPAFAGQRVPHLAELVDLMNRTGLNANLELKLSEATPDRVELFLRAVVRDLDRLSPSAQVIVSSFDHELLAAFHAQAPRWPIACLFDRFKFAPLRRRSAWCDAVRSTGATYVHPHHRDLSPKLARAVRDAGIGLNTWTVNDPTRAAALTGWGVEGICTDGPESLTPQTAALVSRA